MTRAVRWTARSASQLAAAALYLEEANPGHGTRLVEQVEAVLQVASENPKMFPRIPNVPGCEVRRGLIRKYDYWVIYEIRPREIVVLSVWHAARRPEGWTEA